MRGLVGGCCEVLLRAIGRRRCAAVETGRLVIIHTVVGLRRMRRLGLVGVVVVRRHDEEETRSVEPTESTKLALQSSCIKS